MNRSVKILLLIAQYGALAYLLGFSDCVELMTKPLHFTDIQKRAVFQNQEITFQHNPYDQEIRELSSIENGDTGQLSRSWDEDYVGRIGTLAKPPLRHCQNLGIVLVALGARAAIRGGLLPEVAFSLSDSYINQIEEVKNPEAAVSLGRKAEYQYTLLVKKIKAQHKSHSPGHVPDPKISMAKDYICSHLHGKISTSDVARAIYMNPSYLSDLFRKEDGITVSGYILQEKIKLGKKFKQETGLTLRQYREKYGVKEFDTFPSEPPSPKKSQSFR